MNRWRRIALRRIAGWMLDVADGLRESGDALMEATERKRVRPLVFPSRAQIMLREMIDEMAKGMVIRLANDLLNGPPTIFGGPFWPEGQFNPPPSPPPVINRIRDAQ